MKIDSPATSQYYGLAGGGSLFFLEQTESGAIHETKRIEWTDGLFDVVSQKPQNH